MAQSTALPRYGYAVQDRNGTCSEEIREAVSALLPGYSIDTVEQLGSGTDHVAHEVNGELIVRFTKEADLERRAELMRREHELLAAVAQVSLYPCLSRCPRTPSLDALHT